jgi:alpha-tubulin suppressor-like RCC1 family protein
MGGCGEPVLARHPTAVYGLDHIAQIAVGSGHSCALRDDGLVWCWGGNGHGVLGQGDTAPYSEPVPVQGLSHVTTIGSGLSHMCAVAPEGVYCWGVNDVGQLGTGATDGMDVLSPTLVATADGFVDVVQIVGSHQATCARTSAGRVFCWGLNHVGIVGNGTIGGTGCQGLCVPVPTAASVPNAVELAMGAEFALARLADGRLVTWGSGTYAALGNGTQSGYASSPTDVIGFP